MKLFSWEEEWLRALLDAVIPPGGESRYPLSASETGAAEVFAEMILYLPFQTALGLRAAVSFFEFVGPLLGLGRLGRFSRLSAAEREECLSVLSKSRFYPVRQMVTLMKMIACFGWGADGRVREALGMNQSLKFIAPSPTTGGEEAR